MADIRIKRGSTLSLSFAFANADGSAFTLAGVTLTLTVADPRGNVLASVPIVASATPGIATVTVANTGTWPEGLAQADVLVNAGSSGQVISQSFGIRVERPVVQIAPDPASYNPITAP